MGLASARAPGWRRDDAADVTRDDCVRIASPVCRLYVVGGVLMLAIVLVLVLSPRAAPGQSGTTIPAGATPLYSTYTIGLIMMSLMMFLGALAALCALGGATLVKVSHARAID